MNRAFMACTCSCTSTTPVDGTHSPACPQPVLAEAMDRAEVTRQALMAALSSALRQQQHYAKLLDRRKREMELERRAMALFFCK